MKRSQWTKSTDENGQTIWTSNIPIIGSKPVILTMDPEAIERIAPIGNLKNFKPFQVSQSHDTRETKLIHNP